MTILPADRPATDRWSPSKLALLQHRLAGGGAAARSAIPRRARDGGPLPMAPAQRGMWTVDRLVEDNSVYSVHQVLRLTGPLDAAALRAAVDALTERHEVLRTAYPVGEEPSLRVEPFSGAFFQTMDLAGIPGAARERKAWKLVRDELAEPFDLDDGPLFRVLLIVLGEQDHILVLNAHHILTDEWSNAVLARDLSALYKSRVTGVPANLPELTVQYADYAAWQQNKVGGAEHDRQLEYWRRSLQTVPPVLDLPTDLPRPDIAENEGADVEAVLAPEAAAAVRALAADHGVTLFTALLALFGAALYRFSGQERFAIGSLLSGRGLAETEPLIGLFANTAAIGADLSGRPAFADLIAGTHRAVVGALDHQDATFAQVVSALGVRRDPSRNPLYQVIFQCVDDTGPSGWDLPGIAVEPVDGAARGTAKVDLTLYAVPRGDTICLSLNYNTGLFTADTPEELLADIVRLAELAAADPAARVPEPVRAPQRFQGSSTPQPATTADATPPSAVNPVNTTASSSTTHALTDLFATALGIDTFGPQDNFFEYGGDSLLLIHVVARARQAGITMTARQVYRHQSPAELAAALDAAGAGVNAPAEEPAPARWPLAGLDAAGIAVLLRDRDEAAIEDVYPLTPLAGGVLVHSLVEPTGYLRQYVLSFEEDFAPEQFRAAWQRVVDRHAGLRTSFVWAGLPHPVQVVGTPGPVAFAEVDLSGEPSQERDRRWHELLETERSAEFDLAAAPPSRVTLVRLGERSHRFVWGTHHIVFDGWTVQVVLDEVLAEYRALRDGGHAELPAPAPLRDYVAWVAGRDTEADADYWRTALAGFQDPTPVPVLEATGAGTGVDTSIRSLPDDLAARLRARARAERVTVGSVLHAAWALLLSRHTGRGEVLFGTVQSGRSAEVDGVERMVGLLANTLPLSVAVPTAPAVGDWLREVHLRLLDLRDHEHSALVDIQRGIGFTGGKRMFETVFTFTDTGSKSSKSDSGTVDAEAPQVQAAGGEAGIGFPLAMEVRLDGALTLRLTYDRALFTGPAAHVLQDHYETLLRAILDAGGTHAADATVATVGDLTMMSGAERELLLRTWNQTERDYPRDATVPQLFDQAVAEFGELPALTEGERTLTYSELAAAANRLARLLIARGVGAETPVAVAMPRSIEFVVAVLAVLKAGGFYVPLDPGNPPSRTSWILRDTGAPLAITADVARHGQHPPVPEDAGVEIVDLDDPAVAVELAGFSDQAPACPASPLSPVVLFYTSGSTGTPKGVTPVHRGISRLVHEPVLLSSRPGDVYLLFNPNAFDAANLELWCCLSRGARLVVSPPGPLGNAEIAQVLADSGATHMWITAGLLHQIVEHDVTALAGIKVLMSGGDVLSPEVVRAVLESCPDTMIANCYGPTENTTYTSFVPIRDAAQTAGKLPIGRPMPNTTVYVLDENLDPVPIGVVGELYTGGDGLARGYLNRPDITGDRFGPDPYSAEPGSRMYRTGDLARWLPDGQLDFCGRIDGQVKIRGYRVETGEIENRLERHPAVAAAAVAAREDTPGRKRLVGYLVPVGTGRPAFGELREFLLRDLPDYMVPSAFVFLEEFPLSGNGKVDKSRLPAPADERPEASTLVPCVTDTERRIAEVWAKVLGLPAVGREDNFFELGGDSILSLRIVAQAREAGLPVTPRQVFDHQSVGALAAALDEAVVAAAVPVVAAEQGPVSGPAPLTAAQRWFTGWGWEPGDFDHFAQSVRLEWNGQADAGTLERALAELVRHHDALRTRLSCENDSGDGHGAWQLHVAAEENPPRLRVADLSGIEPGPDRDAVLAAEGTAAHRSHRLADGPLLAAVLLRLGGGEPDQLVLSVHHLVVDTVSWGVLLADLAGAYRQLAAGEQVALPAKTSSFRQWAQRVAEYAAGPESATESAFWLDAVPAIEPLPVDDAAGRNTAERSATITTALPADQTELLLREVPAAYRARVLEVLLGALADTLRGWTGEAGVAVAVEGHGREPLFDDLDVSRTVGWFTSVYPLVVAPAAAGGAAAVAAVKDRLRSMPHHGVGYGLARHLDPAAGPVLARRGFPQISFNFHSRLARDADGGPALFDRLDAVGEHTAPAGGRPFLIDVIASVQDGTLYVSWTYPADHYRAETAHALAGSYLDSLRALISGRGDVRPAPVPADFPLAGLTAEELDRALAGAADVTDVYPLSPIQVGILFHSVADASGTEYFIQTVHDLEGDLDAGALRRAWDHVTDRHPVLRSTFCWEGLPRPMQLVHRARPLDFRQLDFTGDSPEEQQRRTEELLAAERAAGFDLRAAVPQRFALIRLGANRHRMVWNVHHLLIDGWSVRIVLDELLAAYGALRHGRSPELPAATPYREHIAWLEDRGDAFDRAFWTEALAGISAPTRLPVVAPVATGPGGVGVSELELSPEGARRLKDLCRERRITVSSALQAAWGLVLSRYSGEADVLFGSTQAGRSAPVPGIEDTVGVFISTLPIRVRVDPNQPIGGWLDAVHGDLLRLRDHEHASLSAIQRRTGIPAEQPLFESIFVSLIASVSGGEAADGSASDAARADGGLALIPQEGYEQTGYPLLLAAEIGEGVGFRLTHDPARVGAAAAGRLLGAFHQAVEDIAADPDRAVGALFRLPPEQADLVLDRWNRTRAEGGGGQTVLDRFRAVVARTPEAAAVESDSETYSYSELAEHADRIAGRLRRLGLGTGSLVGVHLGRSARTVAVQLAVVAAGAAYLPLDPTYPPDRLAYIAQDSGAGLVITSAELPPVEGHGVPTIDVEELWSATDTDTHAGTLVPRPLPGDPVYTIYTSGSTGRPKGVDIAHGSLLNLVQAIGDLLASQARDTWLALTSSSFDISNLELFLPLITGGRLVVVPEDAVYDGAELLALIRRHRVTHVQATPSAWTMLLAAGFDEPGVVALSGGEPLPRQTAADLAARSARLVNVYGPTETTIWSTAGIVPADPDPVTVGGPLANQTVYLLDADLLPVPIGAVGELYIGGAGLALGYRNRPALTAERFRPDPFGAPGGRIYGTGDSAYQRENGEIVVLGRLDNQVKVRGHRIEPGEIESCLGEHERVDRAAVVVRPVAGAERLVAYVTGADGCAPDPVQLRRHLLGKLPNYMVPSVFTVLDRMPLTPNGKLDRRALPAPAQAGAAPEAAAADHVPPRTATERLLAGWWAEALGRERVGVTEGYFEIGGDSLRAIQITGAARRAGVVLNPRDLFERPNIRELAAAIDAAAQAPEAPEADAADAASTGTAEHSGATGPVRTAGRDPISSLMARHRVGGVAVAVIRGGRLTECRSHGVPADALFQVGSLSKHMTALAVLTLADQGRIDLDADAAGLLTTWRVPLATGGRPVTVRALLSHTAGLSVRGAQPYQLDEPLPTIAEVLRGSGPCRSPAIEADPAVRAHRYSATNYAVLQALLEEVTGEPFDALMRRLVFGPLGMRDSWFDGPGIPSGGRRATGHRADGRPYQPGWAALPESAAAGLWSTPADLARAAIGIHRAVTGVPGALFGPAAAEELLTPVPGHEYGLGTVVRTIGGRRWIGHHGDTEGFRCSSVSDPESGDGLVVATDSDAGADLIRDLLTELEFGFLAPSAPPEPLTQAGPVAGAN